MKNSALQLTSAVLFPLIMTGTALTCSVAIDPNNPNANPFEERNFYGQIFGWGNMFLLPANILFGLFAHKKYVWGLFLALLSIPVQIAIFFASMIFSDSCMESAHQITRAEFGFLVAVLISQVICFVFAKPKAKFVLN